MKKTSNLLLVLILIFGNSIIRAQDVLPFPTTPSASYSGRTLQESEHKWRTEKSHLPDDAPYIAEDDEGHSYSYGMRGFAAKMPPVRAMDWFGVRPGNDMLGCD